MHYQNKKRKFVSSAAAKPRMQARGEKTRQLFKGVCLMETCFSITYQLEGSSPTDHLN